MGDVIDIRRLAAVLTLLSFLTAAPPTRADSAATLVVPDRLGFPGEEIYIEATLFRSGLLGLVKEGIQGELLCFSDPQGNPIRNLLTDPSGTARIRYTAGPPGQYPITVRLADNPRHSADPAKGNLFVRDKKTPLLFVMVEAGLMAPVSTPWLMRDPEKSASEPGSAEALTAVAPCYALVYLTQSPKPSLHRTRSWLEKRDYPPGPIYFLDSPPLTGFLSEAPPPQVDVFESLWKERSVPAHLLTRDRGFAEAAAEEGVGVLLLEPKASPNEPSGGEGEETGKGEGAGSIVSLEQWGRLSAICPCETEEESQEAFEKRVNPRRSECVEPSGG